VAWYTTVARLPAADPRAGVHIAQESGGGGVPGGARVQRPPVQLASGIGRAETVVDEDTDGLMDARHRGEAGVRAGVGDGEVGIE